VNIKKKVLIVDDEPSMRRILEVALEKAGYQTVTAENGPDALKALEEHDFDCMTTDVTMPGMTGYQLQAQVRELYPALPVIIVTAYGTIQDAIAAIRNGAYDFVTKPFDIEHLKRLIRAAIENGAHSITVKAGKGQTKTAFVAESEVMQEIYRTIEQVADSRASVLITGESGTGKEVVAKLIHELSCRSHGPFIACSCAALPETLLESELFGYEKGAFTGANGSKVGRFEAAHLGTLFLDEIGEVPLPIQAKLLRVLQEREFERLGSNKPIKVDVRLVTATNRDLQREVDADKFRLDLLYRLQVIEIKLPPLRERQDDILPLANHFLEIHSKENGRSIGGFTADAVAALLQYSWPGNVRELSNVIERAVVLSPSDATEITQHYLPKSTQAA